MKTATLAAKGFTRVMVTPQGEAWVRLTQKGNWMIGDAVVHFEGAAFRLQAAFDMKIAKLEVLGQIAANPHVVADLRQQAKQVVAVGGTGFLKGLGKKFREKLNKAARQVAKMKVVDQLRKTYAKVLQSPIADMGIAAGARALSAFGVPAAATKAAINQRRFAQVDRLQHGGWAGMIAEATGEGGLKAALKTAAKRNLEAGKKALVTALPGGQFASAAGNLMKGALGDKLKVSGLPCDCVSTGYENIWELGHYG